MSNENQSKDINVSGDGNTFIGNASEVNITGPVNVVLAGDKTEQSEMIQFGDLKISAADASLLEEFKKDYSKFLEYCIKTDFASELVDINFGEEVRILYDEKWRFKSRDFSNRELRKLKNKILKTLNELMQYVSPEYLRLHEATGMLIFKNQSWEEGCKLRDEFHPNSDRLRQEIANLYVKLYPEEFQDEIDEESDD